MFGRPCVATAAFVCAAAASAAGPFYLLDPSAFEHLYGADLPWAAATAPFFEADSGGSANHSLTEAYAYRWRLFKRHIVATNGTWNDHAAPSFVVTEFLPAVGWSGKYNTIACSAFHHINEVG